MGKLWRRGENSTWMEVVATWRVAVETWREYDNKIEDFVMLNEATRVMMISESRDSSGCERVIRPFILSSTAGSSATFVLKTVGQS